MKLNFLIQGREAVPVRAIPLITGWKTFSPDAVAAGMARKCDWDRLGKLIAFHISDGAVREILPKEWDRVVIAMNDVSESCKSRSDWETRSLATLPVCFVWRDEFEVVYQSAMRVLTIVDERPGDKLLNWSPPLSDEQKSLILEGFECFLEDVDRFHQRQFLDGFNGVREPVIMAKRLDVAVSESRCKELASQDELHIGDWTELVSVGIGQHESYLVTKDRISFRRWGEDFIAESPLDWQVGMHRENRIAPELVFPCSPSQLLEFVDTAVGIHGFKVPDAFREEVVAITSAEDVSDASRAEIERLDTSETETAENDQPTDNRSKPVSTKKRNDGLTIAMEQGWHEYVCKHGTMPSARALFDLLAKDASEAGLVIAYNEKDDKLTWRRQDGGLADTSFKAFQGRFTKLKNRM